MNKIHDKILMDFLNNHAEKGETKILTKGKEFDELVLIAEERGYKDIKESATLKLFKNIYGIIDKTNGNGACLNEEVLKKLPSLIGKPINMNHNKKYVVGHFIDYRYNAENKQIIVYGVFYQRNFPEEYTNLKNKFKNGKLGTSFEALYKSSKIVYTCGDCGHVQTNKTTPIVKCDNCGTLLYSAGKYGSKKHKRDLPVEEFSGGCIVTKDGLQAEPEALVTEFAMLVGETANDEIVMGVNVNKEEEKTQDEKVIKEELKSNPIIEEKSGEQESVDNDEDDEKPEIEEELEQAKQLEVRCVCMSNGWKILRENESSSEIQCIYCNNKYRIEYEKESLIGELGSKRILTGNYTCPAVDCNSLINYTIFSNMKELKLKCKKCGIKFALHLNDKTSVNRAIKSMEQIGEEKATLLKECEDMTRKENLEELKKVILSEALNEEQATEVKKEEVVVEKAEEVVVKETVKEEEVKAETVVDEKQVLKDKIAKLESELSELQNLTEREVEEFKKQAQKIVENAKKIAERRQELGQFAENLSDEDILNETKYDNAKLKQQVEILKLAVKENAVQEVAKEELTDEVTVTKVADSKVPIVGENLISQLSDMAQKAVESSKEYQRRFGTENRRTGWDPNKK